MSIGKNLLSFKSGVKKIRPQDRELSDVQDNLANSLQGVMDHLLQQSGGRNQARFAPLMYQPNPNVPTLAVKVPALQLYGRYDGPFIPNQPSIIFGEAAYTSATGPVAQRDSCLFSYGQIVAFGSAQTTDGFVLIPQVAGPAFRIAPNNTYTCFQVNFDGSTGCTGPFNAASVRSDVGFKTWLPGMFYWNTNYPGGTVPLVITVTNGSLASTTPWGQPMTRAGSIVGLTAYHTAQSNMVCAVTLFKNGSQIYIYNITNNSISGTFTLPKGTLPFVAGDFISAKIGYSAAGLNVCTQVALEVEEVA